MSFMRFIYDCNKLVDYHLSGLTQLSNSWVWFSLVRLRFGLLFRLRLFSDSFLWFSSNSFSDFLEFGLVDCLLALRAGGLLRQRPKRWEEEGGPFRPSIYLRTNERDKRTNRQNGREEEVGGRETKVKEEGMMDELIDVRFSKIEIEIEIKNQKCVSVSDWEGVRC